MKKKIWFIVGVIVFIALIATGVGIYLMLNSNVENQTSAKMSSFTSKFIKQVNKYNENSNYVVSPYSVEIALSMLKEGSNGNTEKQISNVIKEGKTGLNNKNVKLANALFIEDTYKDVVEKSFINTLRNKYKSELLVSKFEDPKLINDWVKKKTDGMIPKVLDNSSEEFVLGMANVIAINTRWKYQFDCEMTDKEKFINNDDSIDVEMMHNTYDEGIKYLDGDVKGILLPYKDKYGLEFIGLMPQKDLNKFIDSLDNKNLNKYLNSFKKLKTKQKLELSLPRFSYEYDFQEFKDGLENIGIKDVFSKKKAVITKIIKKKNQKFKQSDNLYISVAVHKAKIKLNEKGTKAAAVTYYGAQWDSIQKEVPKIIDIKFNKPFMYIIRDKKSKEILFFGTVYEPNKWKGNTCTEEN